MKKIRSSGCEGYLRFLLEDGNGNLLMASFIARSSQEGRGIVANIMRGYPVDMGYMQYRTRYSEFSGKYTYVHAGDYAGCPECFVVSKDIYDPKTKKHGLVVLTDAEQKYERLYNTLMVNFKLPLKESWMEVLYDELRRTGYMKARQYVQTGDGNPVQIGEFMSDKLQILDLRNLDEENLEKTVTSLIRDGKLVVCEKPQKPMTDIKGFDDYIKAYGPALVDRIRDKVAPATVSNGTVDHVVTKEHRLYASQADAVKGIVDTLDKSRYCIMNEGMGSGKTMQGLAACDAYAVQKYLRKNPSADLKEAVERASYRTVILAPSHLVEKWKDEAEREIVNLKGTIITDFSQLVNLYNNEYGKAPHGKELFVISKDFGKLQYSQIPVPTRVKTQKVHRLVCAGCGAEKGEGKNVCVCGERRNKLVGWKDGSPRYATGLVCPECGEVLIPLSAGLRSVEQSDGIGGLTPADFATMTTSNDHCFWCGCKLWKPRVKLLGDHPHEEKWYTKKRYTNANKKSTSTIFLLKGHEQDYILKKQGPGCMTLADLMDVKEVVNRKFAPLRFIKKKLSGFFDFCIMDEAHKFKGGSTAQGIAAGWLIDASKKTLALTGTLSGGKAEDLFYLLYRLDPARMLRAGFKFEDSRDFSGQYGCTEEEFTFNSSGEDEYNSNSRGKKVGQTRVKPGISPLVFSDFLMDRTVFLDLKDMSNQLPPLHEYVEGMELDEDIKAAYNGGLSTLKAAINAGEKKLLGAYLQYALSYTDKPYGRDPILSPETGRPVMEPVDLPHYKSDLTNKEKRLVEIVENEISEGRCCFVYAEYTRSPESSILGRLKGLLERNVDGLSGHVAILESGTPDAQERMNWIKQKAAEGIKVIICNPMLCECGLDFIFEYKGIRYNFPTIVFFQMGYNLTVLWQAASRHYRLIQTEECRTYYLYSEGTVQLEVLRLMARKKAAVNVLQGGGFSQEGLTAMADGINVELELAKALSEGISSSAKEEVERGFREDEVDTSEQYEAGFISHPLYTEIGGVIEKEDTLDVTDFLKNALLTEKKDAKKETAPTSKVVPFRKKKVVEIPNQLDIFDAMDIFDGLVSQDKTTSKKMVAGQMLLF